VHSLLASKGLLGGIGQQVSEIAKQMNDSIATTTVAEVAYSRAGSHEALFGASAAANTISETVAQNQSRIDDLTTPDQANVSTDVHKVLKW
jgi:methylaspartate ammonia-lyase